MKLNKMTKTNRTNEKNIIGQLKTFLLYGRCE